MRSRAPDDAAPPKDTRIVDFRGTTVFEYLYRDASNYKAFGEVLVQVSGVGDAEAEIRAALGNDGTFIAEQCGLPPLYAELWSYSRGPTEDDHAWHEFVGLRTATESDRTLPDLGPLEGLLERLRTSATAPEFRLSPHGGLVD